MTLSQAQKLIGTKNPDTAADMLDRMPQECPLRYKAAALMVMRSNDPDYQDVIPA